MPPAKKTSLPETIIVNFHMQGDSITVDDLIDLQEGSMSQQKAVLAKLVRAPSGKMLHLSNPIKALELVGQMSLSELNEAAQALIATAQDGIVPKGKGKQSE